MSAQNDPETGVRPFGRRTFFKGVGVAAAAAAAAGLPGGVAGAGTSGGGGGGGGSGFGRRRVRVVLTEGTNLAAIASPARDRLIVELQGRLWALPITGGQAERLTDPELEPARPDWSPDGSRLAFQAYRTGQYHIWTSAPDGSDLRQHTDGPWDDREAAWSRDGQRIAFSSDRAGEGSYDIWTVEVATGELRRWTSGADNDYAPTWSADGASIVFVRSRTSLAMVVEDGSVSVLRTLSDGARVERPSMSATGSPTWTAAATRPT